MATTQKPLRTLTKQIKNKIKKGVLNDVKDVKLSKEQIDQIIKAREEMYINNSLEVV